MSTNTLPTEAKTQPSQQSNANESEKEHLNIVKQISEATRKFWRANLGIYGKAIDRSKEEFEKLNKETHLYFEELIQKGEALDKEIPGIFSETKEKLTADLEESATKAQKAIFRSNTESKLDLLIEKVDKLLEANQGKVTNAQRKQAA